MSTHQISRPIGATYRHGQRMSADAAHFCTLAGRNARNDMHAIQGGRKTHAQLRAELIRFMYPGAEQATWSLMSVAREYLDAVCYAAHMPIHDPGEGCQWVVCTNVAHRDAYLDSCPYCVPHWGWVVATAESEGASCPR